MSRRRSEPVSRSAWLELREELALVNDGYRFLDEKRIMLAAEMLRERDAWRRASRAFEALCERAGAALIEATADLGVEGLQVYPAATLDEARVTVEERPSVGLRLLRATLQPGAVADVPEPVLPSPAARDCGVRFGELLVAAAGLAALTCNLKRLAREYRRTERRVRALENVVLPEIRADLAAMQEHLDLVEQEEVIRVRTARGAAP